LKSFSAFLAAFLTIASWSNACRALDLYVAADGDDARSGCLDASFATVERARDEIRRLKQGEGLPPGGVTVHVRRGEYLFSKTLELAAEDSGTQERPVVYQAHGGEAVRWMGGRRLTGFAPVTDPAMRTRLDKSARDYVLVADLKAAGVTDFGDAVAKGKRPELFFKTKPMTLARWPNEGFAEVGDLVGGKPKTVHGKAGDEVGKFTYDGDRPKRWSAEDEMWLVGFWFWDWAEGIDRIDSIDTDKRIISLKPPYHHYGYRQGQRYYALNLLAELDAPGEWYLDRKTGKLYFWPPTPIDEDDPILSILPTLISMDNASHVTFRGLTLEATRDTAVKIKGGSHNLIAGCVIRNTGRMAVQVDGGTRTSVVSCDIYNTGGGGINLIGGDRKTLTPGHNSAVNNHIHHYSRLIATYGTGVVVHGVGNRVAHNLIHDAPHMGIYLAGNENVIELNELHHVCLSTDDAGAFYMGRDWTQRGNIVRHNYFHHIGSFKSWVGTQSIYLDDWTSDVTVYGNVCYKGGRGVLVGGGRNNTVENNVFVECNPSVHIDSRGLGWASYYFNGKTNTLIERLNAMNYREPPYSERYPELLTLYDDEPALAKYNVVRRNISIGGKWLDLRDGLTDKIVTIEDNLVDGDPRFVDPANQDFRLQEGSPALAKGFKPIPFEKIGLCVDEYRTKLPEGGRD
jgi:hypothetical protein